MPTPPPDADGSGGSSGRRLIISAAIVVLVLWGSLYLAFRIWRIGYRERAAFGVRHVAAALDPLASIVPPGVDPNAWHEAVSQTHAMLVTVTSSNVMDMDQLGDLSRRVTALVTRARSETSLSELTSLWNDLEQKAGPIVRSRHPRPKLLPPPPDAPK